VKPVHVILWEFQPRAGREAEFEQAYGADGEWAKLFALNDGFRGTELLKSATGTYLTIDHWTSADAFAEFQRQWHAEYEALDRRMESLTQRERSIGQYESA
jgi:heme-degrading monooxygenase HmoA